MRCGTTFIPPDPTGNATRGARADSRVCTLMTRRCNSLLVGKLFLRLITHTATTGKTKERAAGGESGHLP